MPVSAERLSIFLAHLGQGTSGQAAISSAVASIAHRHATEGLPSPTSSSEVRKTLAGIKRSLAKPTVRRDPLTFDILKDVGAIVRAEGSTTAWRTFWRMNMQFFALLRWEEVSRLRVSDLLFHPHHMDIHISRSKTDQFQEGSSVRIARQPDAPASCPVNVSAIYIRMLKYEPHTDGFMQPRLKAGTGGGIANSVICYSRALQDLKRLIERSGRDSKFFGEHSGRRGGASAAAEAGAEWTDLKRLGRWSSDAAPQLYVENTQKNKSRLPNLLARAAVSHSSGAMLEPAATQEAGARKQVRGPVAVDARVSAPSPFSVTLPPVTPIFRGPQVTLP